MVILGAILLCGCATVLFPDFPLALLIVIAGIKDAPFLHALPSDATVLTAGVLIAACAARTWARGLKPLPAGAVFAYLLAVIIVVAVLWSPDLKAGLSEATRFETLTLLAFFAPFALIRDERDLSILMGGLVVFSLVVVLLAVPTGDPNQPLSVIGTSSRRGN